MTDLDGVCFVKRRGCLTPADLRADEWLSHVGDGREIVVSARKPRNPKFHRKFFSLLHIVVVNDPQERWLDEDALLTDLKIRVGHVETVINGFTGRLEYRAKSISFASMPEDKFSAFFDRACHVLATEILSMAPQALVDEVMNMIEPQKRNAA